jgi:hypothetical protein
MQAIKPYIELVDKVLYRIGYSNIIVGGLTGAATLAL